MGSYTNFFADALIAEAELDARIVGIHAAMGGGTGMNRFEKRFHDRTFDVGIAEQARRRHPLCGEKHQKPPLCGHAPGGVIKCWLALYQSPSSAAEAGLPHW